MLGLGRLGGTGQSLQQYLRPERRKRRRYGLTEQTPAEFENELLERIRQAPAEGVGDTPHGALQWALDLLDLPRNAIANLVNLGVGAEPRRRQKGLMGLPVVSAGDMLDKLGISASEATGGHTGGRVVDFLADFMGNVALDPLSWVTLGTSGIIGSAGRKVGQTVLTKAGEKALGTAMRRVGSRAYRGAYRKAGAAGAEPLAAREAAREAMTRPFERAGQRALRGVAEALPSGKLGREFVVQRGRERAREVLAKRLVRTHPELEDVNWLGVTTRGLKHFHPTDLPAALAGIVPAMLAPGLTRKYLAPAYRAVRTATHPIVNPLKFLPAADKTLITREMARGLGLERLGGAVSKTVGRLPGAGPLAEGVRQAGRELRQRFDPGVIPARPGDAEDQLRYEVERFGRYARERTARRTREVAYTEVPKLRGWIAEAAKGSGLSQDVVGAVAYDLSEALQARDSLENMAVRARRIVKAGGGSEEQAEKLVRFIPKATADLAPAGPADDFGDLWHERPPTVEKNLWGETVEQRPRQGGLFSAAEIEASRLPEAELPKTTERVEITDGLRQMVAKVLPSIPGRRRPSNKVMRNALIEQFGRRAVQQQMTAKLARKGWEAEIDEALDQATKGRWLFAEPPVAERVTGKRTPDLAPSRKLGDAVKMVDGDLNEYAGELAVVDMKQFGTDVVASHAPVRRPAAAGGLTLTAMRHYPEGFQARMREAEASVKQVRGIAGNPKYELLLEFGNDVTGGPPVVYRMELEGGLADVVVQGNGRVAGMAAWRQTQWKAYRAALEQIVGPIPKEIKKPMLVRRLSGTPEDARQLAARGQQAATLRETQIERARAALNALGADVENIPAVRIRKPVTRENAEQFLFDNPEFQEWLLGNVAPTKREQIMASGEELAERVNDVFVAMLPRSVQELAAGLPEKMEAMFTALAPQAAYLHSLRRADRIHPHYDLYPALENAALLYRQIARKRGSYAGIVDELDRIAATPTFAGMEDELSGATQRGMAMAVGMSKASRGRDPSQTMLDGINRVVAAALADDPKQMGLMALDPADTAARIYARAFLPEAVAESVLGKMRAIGAEEVSSAQTQRVVSDLRKAGVQAHGGAEAPSPAVEAGAGGAGPQAPGAPEAELSAARAQFYADLDRSWAKGGRDPADLPAIKVVFKHMDDDVFEGLRFQHGNALRAQKIFAETGRRPAGAYYAEDLLEPAEQAALRATGIVRLFKRADEYDDFGFLLEEVTHHVYHSLFSDTDRALLGQWHKSRSGPAWIETLKARGVRAEHADYYAATRIELFGRYAADYMTGHELRDAEPAVRSLFRKVLDAIKALWEDLVAIDTPLGTDRRIAELIERHYTPPAGKQAGAELGLGRLGVSEGAAKIPAVPGWGRQLRLGEGGAPLGRPGRLEMDDPMRQLVEHIQGRGELRVIEEKAAGVPARRLTTEREIGYLQRILGDRKTRFGGWMRRKGMSVKNARQLMRLRDREKFVSEINELAEEVNRFQRGESSGDARVLETVKQMGLGRGEELAPYLMDPVLSHVARELESVRTIGSAQMLRGLTEMFGVRLVRGRRPPSGYLPVEAKQFGEITRGFVFKPETAAVIEAYVGQWDRPKQILRGYRRLLNLWKGWALFAPAYHLRNLFGNVFNSMLGDGYSTRAFSEGMEIVQAAASGKGLDRRIAGTPETYGSLYKKLAVDHGRIGSGFFGVEVATHRNRVQQIIEAVDHPPSAGRALELARQGHPLLFNRTVGMMAEDASKIGFVITRLRRGDELGPAVDRMVKHLFDYSELTDFERGTTGVGMRDVIPFYTWTRKNSQLLLQVALTEPRKLAIIPKIQLTVERHLAGDETLPWQLRPAHIMREGGVQISGGLRPKFANIGYMLPIGELPLVNPFKPGGGLRRLAEQAGGPARTAAELVANYDMFFDRPIKEYPGQRKRFLGAEMPPAAKHVARTLRPLNFAEQVRRMAEASRGPAETAAGMGALLSGVRAFPVSVPRQVYQAERRINEQVGAVRRDMKRRIAQVIQAGGSPVGDAELARLLAQHEELIRRREGLPTAEVRRQGRAERRTRQDRFDEYLEQARAERDPQIILK